LLQTQTEAKVSTVINNQPPLAQAPPTKAELLVPECPTVRELAALLKQEQLKITTDLMQLGVFANVNHFLDFELVSRVAANYGYLARKPT
jgi:hypothetical protein